MALIRLPDGNLIRHDFIRRITAHHASTSPLDRNEFKPPCVHIDLGGRWQEDFFCDSFQAACEVRDEIALAVERAGGSNDAQ